MNKSKRYYEILEQLLKKGISYQDAAVQAEKASKSKKDRALEALSEAERQQLAQLLEKMRKKTSLDVGFYVKS